MKNVRTRFLAVVVIWVAACGESAGTLNLVLSLPPTGDLRPAGMESVVVGVTRDNTETIDTANLKNMRFEAKSVPLDEPIRLRVELRDNTKRAIAFGRIEQEITPDHTSQEIVIPVRKPMIYVSSERAIVTLDPTGFSKFQSVIPGTIGALAFPLDGTDIGVVSGRSLQRLATADHKPVGTAMDLGVTGASDAARVPDERRMVFATGGGVVVANVDNPDEVRLISATPKPDRVAVGGEAAPFTVYALSGRVAPPTGTLPCTGASTVTAYSLDTGNEQPRIVATGQFSDIEAAGDAVYAANPCTGKVTRIDGAGAFTIDVRGVGALAIEGARVWAAGSAPATTAEGARIHIASARLDGSDFVPVPLVPKAEVMTYDFDEAKELSLNIHADTLVPLDLAVLPGAQYVALITRMDSHRNARFDTTTATKVIPEMNALVHDIVLADPKSGAISQRIRAKCVLTLIANANAEFPDWSCAATSGAETPVGGESVPTTIGVQYGGR